MKGCVILKFVINTTILLTKPKMCQSYVHLIYVHVGQSRQLTGPQTPRLVNPHKFGGRLPILEGFKFMYGVGRNVFDRHMHLIQEILKCLLTVWDFGWSKERKYIFTRIYFVGKWKL